MYNWILLEVKIISLEKISISYFGFIIQCVSAIDINDCVLLEVDGHYPEV
jgi:hypothetical protein